MKKLYSLFFAAALLVSAPAAAQVKFGVKGGLNATDMHISSKVFDASNRAGWFIGPTMKVSLLGGLGLDASLLYDFKESKLKSADGQTEDKAVRQKQVVIPVNLRYGIGLADLVQGFVFAGPQFGYNVGQKEYELDNGTYNTKRCNLSFNVGLGIVAISHFQVTANYNIVCRKSGEFIHDPALVTSGDGKMNSRVNSWQIGVAYYF